MISILIPGGRFRKGSGFQSLGGMTSAELFKVLWVLESQLSLALSQSAARKWSASREFKTRAPNRLAVSALYRKENAHGIATRSSCTPTG